MVYSPEMLPVRQRECVIAFKRAAEPDILSMRGTDPRAESGGINTGSVTFNRCYSRCRDISPGGLTHFPRLVRKPPGFALQGRRDVILCAAAEQVADVTVTHATIGACVTNHRIVDPESARLVVWQ